jgi:hypothetical protein
VLVGFLFYPIAFQAEIEKKIVSKNRKGLPAVIPIGVSLASIKPITSAARWFFVLSLRLPSELGAWYKTKNL